MTAAGSFPLDLARTPYSYIERPNTTLLKALDRHVLGQKPDARILDVGCGAGANGRALRERHPQAKLMGVEPNARAAELASAVYDDVFNGTTDAWFATKPNATFDALVLSDVLEHVVDPVGFLRSLTAYPGLAHAVWVVSVPNYGVWYNRVNTLFGRFRYGWSGLYDRTHLRFFTKDSITQVLDYAGLTVVEQDSTPSLVQSMAPVLRKFFQGDVDKGEHLTLPESKAFQAYDKFVEPVEHAACQMWPALLGFQIVSIARRRPG